VTAPTFFAARDSFRHNVLPQVIGLALPLGCVLWLQGPMAMGRILLVGLVAVSWHLAFSRVRGRVPEPSGVVAALTVAVLVPPDAPLWQLALGMTIGIVIGEEIFGGRGRSFVHPAVVALTFLMFSFPGETYRTGPAFPAWSILPGMALLLGTGQAAWRILAGLGAAFMLYLWTVGEAPAPLLSGATMVAILYLAADPVASAATNPGRVAHGALVAGLTILFSRAGEIFGSVVFAILMASVFAPVIDRIVITLHMRRRAARYGR
jgi:Na+-transporting NADH:ubiquinone oxidoreductase subunit B